MISKRALRIFAVLFLRGILFCYFYIISYLLLHSFRGMIVYNYTQYKNVFLIKTFVPAINTACRRGMERKC